MTDQQHPITPPDALRAQWRAEAPIYRDFGVGREEWLMASAAQWGADQELEALLVWLRVKGFDNLARDLLAARRPKPPSLKEQALADLDSLIADLNNIGMGFKTTNLRRALKALPND
jgi:hypothetical protein